jgi:orotidine-5'-phosphate decarboxylase
VSARSSGSGERAGSFAARVTERALRLRTRLCVGLDPRPAWFPPGVGLREHCLAVLEACAPFACAVKPQLAFFEAGGIPGLQALAEVVQAARALDLPVILDGKRGDIGSTAEAYAEAWLSGPSAGCALTVNPYLGRDAVEPFVQAARAQGGAIFCLVKTSNPGAVDLQDLPAGDGTVATEVARWVTAWCSDEEPYGVAGAVVGATRPAELVRFRAALPRSLLLLPGVGAQGGKPADLAPAFHPGGRGALVAASRSVEFAARDATYAASAAAAARDLRDAINAAVG